MKVSLVFDPDLGHDSPVMTLSPPIMVRMEAHGAVALLAVSGARALIADVNGKLRVVELSELYLDQEARIKIAAR